MSLATNPNERRASERWQIKGEVQYGRDGDVHASGKILDMSNSGILFTTVHTLLPGRQIELAIDWPAQFGDNCALKLMARGRVVRFEGDCAAVEILSSEFRTLSTHPHSAVPTRAV
jgi:hypothetical protein